MILKKMTKKDWILYTVRMLIFVLLWFGLKIYKENKLNNSKENTAKIIKDGNYPILNENGNKCGFINIKTNDEYIYINLEGEKIESLSVTNNPYTQNPVIYNEVSMYPVSINSETFLYANNGKTILLLFNLRKENQFYLHNVSKTKNNNVFMFCEVSTDNYSFMRENSNIMEIQKWCHANIDSNRYTCFFIQ